jgi:hypothetical protein
MCGTPVWLCSISRQSPLTGGRLSTQVWSPETMKQSIALLRRVVGPAGNADRERIFRMQITTCLHRALTPDEIDRLPDWFHQAEPIDLAGGPVEILYETEPGLPSTRPCHNPTRYRIDEQNPLLWVPLDCKQCGPCIARLALQEARDAATGAPPRYLSEMLP